MIVYWMLSGWLSFAVTMVLWSRDQRRWKQEHERQSEMWRGHLIDVVNQCKQVTDEERARWQQETYRARYAALSNPWWREEKLPTGGTN